MLILEDGMGIVRWVFFGDGFPVMTLLNDCYCCWAKPLLYGVDPNTESALRLSLLSLLMISEL